MGTLFINFLLGNSQSIHLADLVSNQSNLFSRGGAVAFELQCSQLQSTLERVTGVELRCGCTPI